MSRPFGTRAERLGDSIVLHVEGVLDVETSDRLRHVVSPLVDAAPNLVLDLTQVQFMDSAGIHALLTTHAAQMEAGGSFAVRNPSGPVRKILDVTGLTPLLVEPTSPERFGI